MYFRIDDTKVQEEKPSCSYAVSLVGRSARRGIFASSRKVQKYHRY